MIFVNSRFKDLVLYADKVKPIDYFKPSVYSAFSPFGTSSAPAMMVKDVRKTIWIDLEKTEDDILMGFKSNTRNEVRKAIREGYTVEEVSDMSVFVDFYNAFAREKNLGEININALNKYPKVLVYQSSFEGRPLTMHANIVDENNKIIRLLYSASVRFDEGVDRKSVGLSNRFLHYAEFLKFKGLGYRIYDFGGINEDENNKEQYNITTFKKGFGGDVKEEIHLSSIAAWLLLKVSIMLSIRSKH